MSGFTAWLAGNGGWLIIILGAFAAGLLLGFPFGWWRSNRAAEEAGEEEHYERLEAMARRTRPVYRQPRPELEGRVISMSPRDRRPRRTSTAAFLDPPEVAHEWGRPPGQLAEDFDVDAIISGMHADVDRFLATVVDRYRPLYPGDQQ